MTSTDPNTAEHRGNNQVHSLEVSPLSTNPCGTSCAASEEKNNHSSWFQHFHRGRVSRSHITSSLLLHEEHWTQQEQKNVKTWDQQFRGGLALLDRDKLEFIIAVRVRHWRCHQHCLGRLFIFTAGLRQLERIMHLSKLSVILKEDNKHQRHYASTKSTKMRIHNADRMFVT